MKLTTLNPTSPFYDHFFQRLSVRQSTTLSEITTTLINFYNEENPSQMSWRRTGLISRSLGYYIKVEGTYYYVPSVIEEPGWEETHYIWMGMITQPGKLVRIEKDDPTARTTYTLAAGEDYTYTLWKDNLYLWMGLWTDPAKLIRVGRYNPNNRTTYTLAAGEDKCRRMIGDQTYIWMTLWTDPGKLVRVLKSDPNSRTTYTLPYGADGITLDSTYVWIGTAAAAKEPTKLVRILRSNPNSQTTWTLDTGQYACGGLLEDDTYIWMGLRTHPPQLVKVLKSDPTIRETFVFHEGENFRAAFGGENNHVWLGLWERGPFVSIISKDKPAEIERFQLSPDNIRPSVLGEDLINAWVVCYTSPTRYYKIPKKDYTLRKEYILNAGEIQCRALWIDAYQSGFVWNVNQETLEKMTLITGEQAEAMVGKDITFMKEVSDTTASKKSYDKGPQDSPAQLTQQQKFRNAVLFYQGLSYMEKIAWYQSSVGSGLFYYNYIIQQYLLTH